MRERQPRGLPHRLKPITGVSAQIRSGKIQVILEGREGKA